jgi:hypothetical protein
MKGAICFPFGQAKVGAAEWLGRGPKWGSPPCMGGKVEGAAKGLVRFPLPWCANPGGSPSSKSVSSFHQFKERRGTSPNTPTMHNGCTISLSFSLDRTWARSRGGCKGLVCFPLPWCAEPRGRELILQVGLLLPPYKERRESSPNTPSLHNGCTLSLYFSLSGELPFSERLLTPPLVSCSSLF